MFICLSAFSQDEQSINTYYLIRHAEKVVSKNSNPDLTDVGKLRAEKWVQIFKNIQFDAIYSTNYIRTMSTAKPIATAQNLEITKYHPVNINFEKFLKSTNGKTVLIVGHSNTIPGFVNKLIGAEKYPQMEDDNNSNLYIIEISGSYKTDKLLFIN